MFQSNVYPDQFLYTILEKSYRTAGDTVDLWEIEMDEMHIMIRFSI